jgi:activator of HSP90 ATPase
MREQLEHDISTIEYEIQVAEESEAELRQWKVEEISQGDITDITALLYVVNCASRLRMIQFQNVPTCLPII